MTRVVKEYMFFRVFGLLSTFLAFCFSLSVFSQETGTTPLRLKIKTSDTIEAAILNELEPQIKFNSFENLRMYSDSLVLRMQYRGYSAIQKTAFEKLNDSTYCASYSFGKPFALVKLYYDAQKLNQNFVERISTNHTDSFFVIPYPAFEQNLRKISKEIVRNGSAFSTVQINDYRREKDTLIGYLSIKESQQRKIDALVLRGYEKFPKSFIKHIARLRTQQPFNKAAVLKKSNRLKTLPFALIERDAEVLFTNDSTKVYLYPKKKKANSFDGFLGFSNSEDTESLVLDGYLNLNLINNLNYGEQVNLIYKSDGNEQRRLQIGFKLPYILKIPVSLLGDLTIFRKDSTFVTTSQNATFEYGITPNFTTALGFDRNSSTALLARQQVGQTVLDYVANYGTIELKYALQQNSLRFPFKTIVRLRSKVGTRKTEDRSIRQQKYEVLLSNIFKLNKKNHIYVKGDLAFLNSEMYIFNELYRFGGMTSIRGFEENSLTASLFSLLNTEYRYLLSSDLYIHSILDYGYAEDPTSNLKSTLTSIGLGLGLTTKSGLLSINFANGKSKEERFQFSNLKVHVSLVATF